MAYKDKEKQKAAARKHYLLNKEKMIKRASKNNRIIKDRSKAYVDNYLMSHPCVDCGESDIIVLEFDHVRGVKKYEISNMKFSAMSIATIQKEIDKCEVRCANCHRRVTYKRKHKLT